MMSVFGELDENIERLTDAFDVDVFAMGTGVKVSGEEKDVEGAIRAIDALEKLCKKQPLSSQTVNMVIGYAKAGKDFDVEDLMGYGGNHRARKNHSSQNAGSKEVR